MFATELFHPMLVHFPIVLLALLALADLVALARGVPLSGSGTYASMSVSIAALAGLSAIVTWLAGDAAMDVALGRGVSEALIETHEGLGTTTAIAAVVWALIRGLVWWRGVDLSGRRVLGVAAVDVALFGLVIATAWAGGSLVYEHGVNVMDGPVAALEQPATMTGDSDARADAGN